MTSNFKRTTSFKEAEEILNMIEEDLFNIVHDGLSKDEAVACAKVFIKSQKILEDRRILQPSLLDDRKFDDNIVVGFYGIMEHDLLVREDYRIDLYDFIIKPTFIITSTMISLALQYPELLEDKEFAETLHRGLMGTVVNGFLGTGWDELNTLLKNIWIFLSSATDVFIDIRPDFCKPFTQRFLDSIKYLENLKASGNTREPWGGELEPKISAIINCVRHKNILFLNRTILDSYEKIGYIKHGIIPVGQVEIDDYTLFYANDSQPVIRFEKGSKLRGGLFLAEYDSDAFDDIATAEKLDELTDLKETLINSGLFKGKTVEMFVYRDEI